MPPAMDKRPFDFTIFYFEPSGKCYSVAVVRWTIQHEEGKPEQPYMFAAIYHLRSLQAQGAKYLPGLDDGIRELPEHWEGTIVIGHPQAMPHLIHPLPRRTD